MSHKNLILGVLLDEVSGLREGHASLAVLELSTLNPPEQFDEIMARHGFGWTAASLRAHVAACKDCNHWQSIFFEYASEDGDPTMGLLEHAVVFLADEIKRAISSQPCAECGKTHDYTVLCIRRTAAGPVVELEADTACIIRVTKPLASAPR